MVYLLENYNKINMFHYRLEFRCVYASMPGKMVFTNYYLYLFVYFALSLQRQKMDGSS